MIKGKVCLLGAFAVGKTSLASRFARSIYSDRYLTTVGVEIHQRTVEVDGRRIRLLVWDLAGEDELHQVRMCHLRGSSACLLVVDGTRPRTLETALVLQRRVEAAHPGCPVVLAVNKTDLTAQWALDRRALEALGARGWPVILTSAKTGEGVEAAFCALAERALLQVV